MDVPTEDISIYNSRRSLFSKTGTAYSYQVSASATGSSQKDSGSLRQRRKSKSTRIVSRGGVFGTSQRKDREREKEEGKLRDEFTEDRWDKEGEEMRRLRRNGAARQEMAAGDFAGEGERYHDKVFMDRKRRCSMTSTKEEIISFLEDLRKSGFSPIDETESICSYDEFCDEDSYSSCEIPSRRRNSPRRRNRLSNVSITSADSGVIGQSGNDESYGHSDHHDDEALEGSEKKRNLPEKLHSGKWSHDQKREEVAQNHRRRITEKAAVRSGAEVERVDSGVGSETSRDRTEKGRLCEDCDKMIVSDDEEEEENESAAEYAILCKKCRSRRTERKETIQEMVDTEISYGRDLNITKQEFYIPMHTAGLLNLEQLHTIFLNLDELLDINDQFADKLQDLVELANEQGDEDYATVCLGKLFLESSNMFLAFENYCVNQAQAPVLLEQMERDKELLRIFLHVSQTENSVLRKMNLKSFLMVPVQRIMKYPLLLGRLYKATPIHHDDREAIREAQMKIEDILDHINSKTKGSSGKLKRKGSNPKKSATENIEINKVAMETLGWNRNEAFLVHHGKLFYTQPTDHTWPKKGKSLKFTPVNAILLTLGKANKYGLQDDKMSFPKSTEVREAALVLVREKGGKYLPLREPMFLEHCVVAVDPDYDEVFELQDMAKESYLFKGEDSNETSTWIRHLKLQTKDLGVWRKRRNALPNIMIQTMGKT